MKASGQGIWPAALLPGKAGRYPLIGDWVGPSGVCLALTDTFAASLLGKPSLHTSYTELVYATEWPTQNECRSRLRIK